MLGVFNSRYGYALSCRLKIVQSLRHFEHLAAPLAEAVEIFVKEYSCPSMVLEIIRDISEIDSSELSRDTSATRTYSTFLMELAERVPELMKQCLSLLMVHLDGESSSLRKCVLSILGEIILKVLHTNEQDEALKETRDQFLDCLEDHMHDVHAHVRSSVLQIWGRLCQARAIPLNRQQRVLQLTIGRLRDKSSNVRKQAVQLLTTLLQCNPLTAQLQEEEFREQLEKEREKLLELLRAHAGKSDWDNLVDKMEKTAGDDIEEESESEEEENSDEEDEAEKEVDPDARQADFDKVQALLKEKKIFEAKALMLAGAKRYPKDEFFGRADKLTVIEILKTVYHKLNEPSEQDQAMYEEISKQKILVSYLQDSVRFSEEVNKALPTVCLLLGSKHTTDILEAVNFFVSAFEFGVLNAMMGVRQMLALIWSREPTVKEAVVNAYRKLYIDIPDSNAKSKAIQIVKNFMALVNGATVGELTSLEELICMMVTNKDIGKDCFQVLWQYFTKSFPNATDEEAICAMILLGMVATAEPSIILSNLTLLIDTGLVIDSTKASNLRMAYEVCSAIAKLVTVKNPEGEVKCSLKFESDHTVFACLERALTESILVEESQFFIPFSQKAATVIFDLSEQPDLTAGKKDY